MPININTILASISYICMCIHYDYARQHTPGRGKSRMLIHLKSALTEWLGGIYSMSDRNL